jgi:hypothetical protein
MDLKQKIEQASKDFDNLDVADMNEIVLSARSLSLEECYDLCLIDATSLSAEEAKFCEQLHRYGRASGVKDATEKLFYQMQTKGGGQTAIDYLRQMGKEFSVDAVPVGGGGFAFQINIPDTK